MKTTSGYTIQGRTEKLIQLEEKKRIINGDTGCRGLFPVSLSSQPEQNKEILFFNTNFIGGKK